jgi:hypothetical protein
MDYAILFSLAQQVMSSLLPILSSLLLVLSSLLSSPLLVLSNLLLVLWSLVFFLWNPLLVLSSTQAPLLGFVVLTQVHSVLTSAFILVVNRSHQQYGDHFQAVLFHLSAKMSLRMEVTTKTNRLRQIGRWKILIWRRIRMLTSRRIWMLASRKIMARRLRMLTSRKIMVRKMGNIDIALEEDEVDAAIGGEEHEDGDGLGDGDLYGTVTAPIDHSNPEDHIYRRAQAEKHVNNGARKQAGCCRPTANKHPHVAKKW